MNLPQDILAQDSWTALRRHTQARIALGRSGVSLPTREHLRFQLDHARARDAVHLPLDEPALLHGLQKFELPVLHLHSQAADRGIYLTRPDLGRKLDEPSRVLVAAQAGNVDLAVVMSEGLSAAAISRNVVPFLDAFLPLANTAGLSLAPLCFVTRGRVAVADDVGFGLGAKITAILIGERPGLSAADSMGIYLTFGPKPGTTDERRNCISNVRPEGFAPHLAAEKLMYLIEESLRRKLSGVELKDNQPATPHDMLTP